MSMDGSHELGPDDWTELSSEQFGRLEEAITLSELGDPTAGVPEGEIHTAHSIFYGLITSDPSRTEEESPFGFDLRFDERHNTAIEVSRMPDELDSWLKIYFATPEPDRSDLVVGLRALQKQNVNTIDVLKAIRARNPLLGEQ